MPAQSTWPQERLDRVKARWMDGASAGEIAAELGGGVTRNAVLGQIHRRGWSERSKGASAPKARGVVNAVMAGARAPKPAKSPKADRPLKLSGHVHMPLQIAGQEKPPTLVVHVADAFLPLEGSTPRTLYDRPDKGCTWTVGEDATGEVLFCSEPSAGRWCETHNAINRAKAPKMANGISLLRSIRGIT